MKLLHKILPEKLNSSVLGSIGKFGLLPKLPCEYKMSLPEFLREVPIVWLAERMNTIDGVIFSVDTDKLDITKLYKLDWGNVNWWVYAGLIPSEVIEKLIDGEKANGHK